MNTHTKIMIATLTLAFSATAHAVDRHMAIDGANTSDCSNELAPCLTLQYAMQQMLSGDTLFIDDGEYTSPANTIWQFAVPPAGTPSQFTVIRAKNIPCQDGIPCDTPLKVKFSGDARFSAENVNNVTSYVKFWGIRWNGITTHTRWDHIHFKQVASQGILDGNYAAIAIAGQHNLLEDVIAFGKGRNKFLFYDHTRENQTYGDGNNVCRRCIARHDWANKNESGSAPIAGFSSYFNRGTTCLNCMVIDSDTPSEWLEIPTELSGAYYQPMDSGPHAFSIKGSIALNVAMAAFANRAESSGHLIENLAAVKTAGGLLLRGETAVSNSTLRDVGVDNFTYRSAAQIEKILGDNDGAINAHVDGPVAHIENSLFHDIQNDVIAASGTSNNLSIMGYGGQSYVGLTAQEVSTGTVNHAAPVHNVSTMDAQDDAFLKRNQPYPVRVEPTDDSDSFHSLNIGARIMHPLGPDGSFQGDTGWDTPQTDTPLWPWPLEAWVQAEMRTSEHTTDAQRGFAASGETLTNYVWSYLGATPPPFEVAAAPSGKSIQLTWAIPVQLDNITQFNVYDITGQLNPVIPGTLPPVATVAGNSFQVTIPNLTAGQQYDYAVTAVDSIKGESGYSYAASATPVLVEIETPQNGFIFTPSNNSSITVDGLTDADSSVEVLVNNNVITTITASNLGAWSTTLDLSSTAQYGGELVISARSNGDSSNTVTGINLFTTPSKPTGLSIQLQ